MDSRSRNIMLMLVAAAALSAAPITAAAFDQSKSPAKIDGNWDMSVTGPDGNPMSVKAVFTSDGKKITGTLTSPQGVAQLEGEYADGKILFGISIDGPEGPMKIGFAGNVQEDGSLAGIASGPFGEIPWTAKKSAAK